MQFAKLLRYAEETFAFHCSLCSSHPAAAGEDVSNTDGSSLGWPCCSSLLCPRLTSFINHSIPILLLHPGYSVHNEIICNHCLEL